MCPNCDSVWDKSSIKVAGKCKNDKQVCFKIYNTGKATEGDMDGPSEYRIYMNDSLVTKQSFLLASQDSLEICLPSNGNTFVLTADQRPHHPGKSRPRAFVEGCGDSLLNKGAKWAVSLMYEEDDQDIDKEIFCRVVTGSFDPNDKSALPIGRTVMNYVDSTVVLNYLINFQNTGTDTAFTVIIKDTLSPYLDITTVNPGASSHPYSYTVTGKNLLIFKFDNILLPDSNINEQASHGFVSYKIMQKKNNVYGAVIKNTASIYFDFNDPVITNTVLNSVGVPPADQIIITDVMITSKQDVIRVMPNPLDNYTWFTTERDYQNMSLVIFDVTGRVEDLLIGKGDHYCSRKII